MNPGHYGSCQGSSDQAFLGQQGTLPDLARVDMDGSSLHDRGLGRGSGSLACDESFRMAPQVAGD